MGANFNHLTRTDRIRLESFLACNMSVSEIASRLNKHRSSIYREMQRGKYIKRSYEYEYEPAYSFTVAQTKYENNLKDKGKMIKLGTDRKLASFIERKIKKDKFSPAAILGEIRTKKLDYNISFCLKTFYNWIHMGVFDLLPDDLPGYKKKRCKKKKVAKRINPKKKLITERPSSVDDRAEFGHWEMDTVVGKISDDGCLLVLTERKTRYERIIKLKNKMSSSVVKALDELELEYGGMFKSIFKTVTSDNGTEFSDIDSIERSISSPSKKRFDLYFCHPYTSCERGTNEVTNRLIRRFIPKNTYVKIHPKKHIKEIENWINNYPRRIFGYKTAEDMFQKELELIKLRC